MPLGQLFGSLHGGGPVIRMDEFHKGLGAVWEFISQMNKYIDVTAPWELAKKKSVG